MDKLLELWLKIPRRGKFIAGAVLATVISQALRPIWGPLLDPPKPASVSQTPSRSAGKSCVLAGGNIYQLVTVYSDKSCKNSVGIIAGADGSQVSLSGAGGVERLDRSTFARSYYVWSNDKAIPR